jgi:hypothetical protein
VCHFGSQLSFLIGKRAPHLVDTQIELFSVTGHYRNSNLIRCAIQDRSSPTVIPGKWKIKAQKSNMEQSINYKPYKEP